MPSQASCVAFGGFFCPQGRPGLRSAQEAPRAFLGLLEACLWRGSIQACRPAELIIDGLDCRPITRARLRPGGMIDEVALGVCHVAGEGCRHLLVRRLLSILDKIWRFRLGVCLESLAIVSNRRPVKKNRRIPGFLPQIMLVCCGGGGDRRGQVLRIDGVFVRVLCSIAKRKRIHCLP